MDEAFGTPPRMRRAGPGQGSFRSSTPYTPFGGGVDHYGSLGRGAQAVVPMGHISGSHRQLHALDLRRTGIDGSQGLRAT